MDIKKFIDHLRRYRQDRKKLCEAAALIAATPNISRNLPLPKQVDQEIKKYCKNVLKGQGKPDWIRILVALTGEFKHGYLPEDFLLSRLIPWLNPPGMTWWVVDKGNLEIIFKDDAVPVLLTFDAGAIRTRDNQLINPKNSRLCSSVTSQIFEENSEICVKLLGYSKGEGVSFISNQEELMNLIASGKRLSVQPSIKQHASLASYNPSSLNSVRVVSLCWQGKIHILSAYLRIGRTGKRMDHDGITVPIDLRNGSLSHIGYDMKYNSYSAHPDTNIEFKGLYVPSVDKIIEIVGRAHSKVFVSRFLGWDIAISDNANPRIIEVNSHPHTIRAQFFNGPLFQSHIDEVLHSWFNQ